MESRGVSPALGRILNKLQGVRKSGTGYTARCPAHDDKRNSLSVLESDGKVLFKCFAGCRTEDIVKVLGVTMADLFEDDKGTKPQARKVLKETVYTITDAAGAVIAEHVRKDYEGGGKAFSWRRDGNPGLNGLKVESLPLYGLKWLVAEPDDSERPIILTEGEKACDALHGAGFLALGTVTGAASCPSEESLLPLLGRGGRIHPWADNDSPGKAHMQRICERLHEMGVETWPVEWPDAPPKGDAFNFIAQGGNVDELLKTARKWEPIPHGPQVTANGGVFVYDWPEHDTRIQIDRVRESKDTFTAEIFVSHGGERIHQARLTLLSGRSRAEIAQQCIKKLDTIEWAQLIEFACLTTVERYRQGEPVVEIGNSPLSEKPQHLLYPFLVEGQANLVYGAGGTCKSYLSATMALALLTNKEIAGIKPTRSAKTLILDYETSAQETNERIRYLKQGLGLVTAQNVLYRFGHQNVVSEIVDIQRLVSEHNVGLVVVDSYGMACGGDAWSQQVARDYFMALRSLRVTTLTIDHIAKGENGSSPFGSVYKVNEARSVWEIMASSEPDSDVVDVSLTHRKFNAGKRLKPVGFRFTFGHRSVNVQGLDVSSVPAFAKSSPMKDRIAALIRDYGPMLYEEIAEELGEKAESVRNCLYTHKALFERSADKKWGIKP